MATVLLIGATVGTGAFAFYIFTSASAIPVDDGPSTGEINVYVSDSRVKVRMDASFVHERSWDNGQAEGRRLENLRGVTIDVDFTPLTKSPKSLRYAIELTRECRLVGSLPDADDYGLTRVSAVTAGGNINIIDPPQQPPSDSSPIWVATVISGTVDLDNSSKYPSNVTVHGVMLVDPANSASGITVVNLPSLGVDPFKKLKYSSEFAAPGIWYRPEFLETSANIGPRVASQVVDSATPALDGKVTRYIQWTSSGELVSPMAAISDRIQQQKSNRRLFIAGVVGGIAGGLLVESITRLRVDSAGP